MATIVNNKYRITYNTLVRIIEHQRNKYRNTYYREPLYLKLPIWLYKRLHQYPEEVSPVEITPTGEHCFRGLIMCPTFAIDDPANVEVF